MLVSNTVNTCQLLSAEVWHVANSKICTKAVDKTLKTFINESKSVKIHEKLQILRNFTETRKMGVIHGRRPISQKMSRPWNRELGWSLNIGRAYAQHRAAKTQINFSSLHIANISVQKYGLLNQKTWRHAILTSLVLKRLSKLHKRQPTAKETTV